MKPKILVIEDDKIFISVLKSALKDSGIEVVAFETASDALALYKANKHSFAVVVIDYNLKTTTGSQVAKKIKGINDKQRILFCTGETDSSILAELLSLGLNNGFIQKGGGTEIFVPIIEEVAKWRTQEKVFDPGVVDPSKWEEMKSHGWIGRSPSMLEVFRKTKKVAEKVTSGDFGHPFLILGDTGVGKELVAKTVAGDRKIFVVDCSQHQGDDKFFESELFGSVKGSYTGSVKDTDGVLKKANGGVVFLDEIHVLSIASQNKLLRVIETREFSRLGEVRESKIKSHFQVVAAANPLILDAVKNGKFKLDLFTRLSAQSVTLPSLNDRPEDIPVLANHFLKLHNKKDSTERRFTSGATEELMNFSWVGNIRQLRNAVDWICLNTSGDLISASEVKMWIREAAASLFEAESEPELLDYKAHMERQQKKFLISALSTSKNQREAALRSGLSRSRFSEMLKETGIEWKEFIKAN